jgi:arabinan endo-1,5-alpha-L-arabinosidase
MQIRGAKLLAQQVPQRLYWNWAAVLLLAACGADSVPPSAPPASAFSGDIEGVHDPSLIKQGSTYYVFSTDTGQPGHIPIRCSSDLKRWTLCGQVFDAIPGWIPPLIPGVTGLWAPDISFFSGKYHVYYAASTFGSNRSLIALATNVTLDPSSPDYAWLDEGVVVESQTSDDWNAIDPNIFTDEQGRVWMSWGSFWGGIKMRRLDPLTGKLSTEDVTLYSLAARPVEKSIEAPFIIWKDSYFLFVSFDRCCLGAESTYKIMAGKSNEVTGPYADRSGTPMMTGGGTLLLAGEGAWRGPGGQSLYRDGATDLLVYHAYSASTGRPSLQISRLLWTDGWPQVLPLP